MSDTFTRSCAHWSEAKRRGMEDFYALATADYRHLAEALDWKEWLERRQQAAGDRPLRLLDVACGSGKFPVALTRHAGVAEAAVRPIDYALLDPSAFSIAEARRVLPPPFRAGAEFETTLQDLDCPAGAFDVAWATHALYAVPGAELEAALERFLHALGGPGGGPGGGTGFIAQSLGDGHYLRFHRLFLDAFGDAAAEPYTGAEAIEQTLRRLGASVESRDIAYENGAPEGATAQVEGFLQRCVFDDTVSLEQMLAHEATGRYLAACRRDGAWRFPQKVRLLFVHAR